MAENGTGMLDIARAINDEDIPSATGKLWSSTGVNFILRNEVYTGTLVWGTRTKDGADLVRVEGAFPAIVSKEQFQSVNKLLRSRGSKTTHPRRTASSYLLSGLITCYRCRTAFTGHGAKSGRFHYYVCQSLIKRGSGSCDSPRLNARRFEELIIGRARSSILTKDSNGDQMTVVVKELDRLIQEQRGRLEIIESELNEVRNRLDRLWYIVESTDVDPADTAPRIRANRDRQVRLETSLQEGNAILSQRRAIRDDVVIMTAKALDMPEFLEKSELPERKVFVETFIRDIVVMPGKAGGPPAAQLATRGQRPNSPPLRPRNMKDPRRNNGRKRPWRAGARRRPGALHAVLHAGTSQGGPEGAAHPGPRRHPLLHGGAGRRHRTEPKPGRMAARKRVSVECKRGVQAVRCGKKVRSECGAF